MEGIEPQHGLSLGVENSCCFLQKWHTMQITSGEVAGTPPATSPEVICIVCHNCANASNSLRPSLCQQLSARARRSRRWVGRENNQNREIPYWYGYVQLYTRFGFCKSSIPSILGHIRFVWYYSLCFRDPRVHSRSNQPTAAINGRCRVPRR